MHTSKTFTTDESDHGKRLDIFLFEQGITLSRSGIKKIIDKDMVEVDGRLAKGGLKLKAGQVITILPFEKDEGAAPLSEEDIPLDILYEDPSLIVINKPPGMVVHPAPGHPSGTLVNAILAKVKDLKPIMGETRPGIVHRLDMETSGVMVVAKDEKSLIDLSSQFKERTVEKAYIAVIIGRLREDTMVSEKNIGRSDGDRKKMSTQLGKGRSAVTHFKMLEDFGELTLVEARPKTGRTHQIRVHLANMGLPIVGDKIYLKSKFVESIKSKSLRKAVEGFPRQALHAYFLRFRHPVTGKTIEFRAEPPDDIKGLLEFLRSR